MVFPLAGQVCAAGVESLTNCSGLDAGAGQRDRSPSRDPDH